MAAPSAFTPVVPSASSTFSSGPRGTVVFNSITHHQWHNNHVVSTPTKTTFGAYPISASTPVSMLIEHGQGHSGDVELIHSVDRLQALPMGGLNSAFRPIKQMTSTLPCASASVSSLSPLRTSTPQTPLRVPQPPSVYARHSASPSSSSSTSTIPTTSTRFPPQVSSTTSSTSSLKPVKPQIIGAGSGNAAAAVTAALSAANRPELSSKTYNELVELARRQQQQIDANRAELSDRQRLVSASVQMSHAGIDMAEQIRSIRADITRDEHELTHLSNAQKQVRSVSAQNDQRRTELKNLQETYVKDEEHLRHAVDKVDSLKKQLELLYRRRASAASAAIAQQRHLNAVGNGISMMPPVTTNGLPPGRPQANVVPFQVQRPAVLVASDVSKNESKLSFDQLDHAPAAGKNNSVHGTPITVQKGVPLRSKRPDKPPPPPKRSPNTVATFGGAGSVEPSVRLMNNGIEVQPPLPPYSNYYANLDQSQAALKRGRADQLSIRNDSMKALKRRSWLQQSDAPEADIFRLMLEESKKGRTHISFADLHAEKPPVATAKSVNVDGVTVNFRQKVAPPLPEHREHRQIQKPRVIEDSETVIHRAVPIVNIDDVPPSVSAGPTVSPVDLVSVSVSPPVPASSTSPSSGYSETSATTDPSESELDVISDIVPPVPKVVIEAVTAVDHQEIDASSESEDALKRELEQVIIASEAEASHHNESETLEDDETEEEDKSAYEDADGEISPAEASSPIAYAPTTIHVNGNDVDDIDATACSSGSSTDGDISSASDVVPPIVFDDDEEDVNIGDEPRKEVKGILRPPGKPKHNKRIVFDPFVLFLDGALEGQLDTVKENAAKIKDVSRPNDEGITALHNAICACHYEIVKFLVDAGANVNAMDSDGWSPLHCAASCNNISMLKLLIENGASIYATTLSDAETPIAKCEEKELGYEQCINYLDMCDRWAGIINDGIVYAAYDFEAEEADDLGFVEGEQLRVISRETDMDSKLWWRCESMVTGQTGLAPSNFLGLYPMLKVAKTINFRRFDVPAHPPSVGSLNGRSLNNNQSKTGSPGNESLDSAFEKSLEISANA